MAKDFDPYYKWLGIPPKDQPPNHYRLLGIEVFESDRDVIDAAANRVMSYLKGMATSDEVEYSQKLLNEVSRARICLLNKAQKNEYDAGLRRTTTDGEEPKDRKPAVRRPKAGNGRPPAPPRAAAVPPVAPAVSPPAAVDAGSTAKTPAKTAIVTSASAAPGKPTGGSKAACNPRR